MEPQNEKFPLTDEKKAATFIENEGLDESPNEATSENDISPLELELLNGAGINESAGDDDVLLALTQLDDTDDDGDKLNEVSDITGEDLDVPGSEIDDENETLGNEDEENNSYSIRDQDDNIDSNL